ncbi:hypothetical protein LTR65_008270 [Meristemomyces frigidus]
MRVLQRRCTAARLAALIPNPDSKNDYSIHDLLDLAESRMKRAIFITYEHGHCPPNQCKRHGEFQRPAVTSVRPEHMNAEYHPSSPMMPGVIEPARVEHYRAYVDALREAEKASKETLDIAADLVYFKLPPELAELVLDHYVAGNRQDLLDFEDAAEAAVYADRFIDANGESPQAELARQHLRDASTPNPMNFQHFGEVEARAEQLISTLEAAAVKKRVEYGRTADSFGAIAAANRDHLVQSLVKHGTLTINSPKFPTTGRPHDSPMPIDFAEHVLRLRHIDLIINVSGNGHSDVYPVELFKLQGNIAQLKRYFPNLETVVVEIRKTGRGRLRARMPVTDGQQYTSMAVEMLKIVEAFRLLECGGRYVCYCYRGQKRPREIVTIKGRAQEVASAVMESESPSNVARKEAAAVVEI